jgi:hypothetical protein
MAEAPSARAVRERMDLSIICGGMFGRVWAQGGIEGKGG